MVETKKLYLCAVKKEKRYADFSDYLRQQFPFKVQKISLHAGFTCPNRDGSKGRGGCTYCNNQTFSPAYSLRGDTVTTQLEEGIRFFAHKYPSMRYLAYFQAYTNTYGETKKLLELYEEALRYPGVEGLIIGTRPDCVSDELLDELARLQQEKFIFIEYGVESVHNRTLEAINRGHTFEDAVDAIHRTVNRHIPCGAHLILGLPGESRSDILQSAQEISRLPLLSIKLHQLQLIRGTVMAREYAATPESFQLYSADEYIELVVDFLEHLRPDLHVDRFVSQSPKELLIAPDWGIKNHVFTDKVIRRLTERDTYQGRLYPTDRS